MKKYLLTTLFFLTAALHAEPGGMLFESSGRGDIVINNRVLAKVNGKALTVIDVMKKMDMIFYNSYPEYRDSSQARFQFYQMSWKRILQELVDKELIMADAEEVKIPVSTADIRQDLEAMFGPNVIENLAKANLTFDEAWEMVKSDITLRRMMSYRVNMKAEKQVTPRKVRSAYEQYAEENIEPARWHYYVVSMRHANEESAQLVHDLLMKDGVALEDLQERLAKLEALPEGSKVSISDLYQQTENEASENYKKVLQTLEAGTFSDPIAQKSRADDSMVYRIFYLEDRTEGGAVPFNDVANMLRDSLLAHAVNKETTTYLNKLRDHYHVQDNDIENMIPEGFEPFFLN